MKCEGERESCPIFCEFKKGDDCPHGGTMNTDRASELIFEAVTGKCWHKQEKRNNIPLGACLKCKCAECPHAYIQQMSKDVRDEHIKWGDDFNGVLEGVHYCCNNGLNCESLNPPLATSLDAWREIWDAMSDEQWVEYEGNICAAISMDVPESPIRHIVQATPLHHLEAALRSLTVDGITLWDKLEREGHVEVSQ